MSIKYYQDTEFNGTLYFKSDGKNWWYWSTNWHNKSSEWIKDDRDIACTIESKKEITKAEMFKVRL